MKKVLVTIFVLFISIVVYPQGIVDEVIKEYQKEAEIYFKSGLKKMELENYYEALQDFNKVTEYAPYNPIGYSHRGEVKHLLKDYNGAIADFTRVIELENDEPNEPNYVAAAYYNRGNSKNELKDFYGAIADYTKFIEIVPDFNIGGYHNRGGAKYSLGDYTGAIADYTRVIEIESNYTDAYYNRGL
jgi:tetratricopeptide (TPR) repeat protein